jgi:hypothetical protein
MRMFKLVMAKFGSELRSEPEPDRTGPYFGVRVRVLTQTGPAVPVTGSANFRTLLNGF